MRKDYKKILYWKKEKQQQQKTMQPHFSYLCIGLSHYTRMLWFMCWTEDVHHQLNGA